MAPSLRTLQKTLQGRAEDLFADACRLRGYSVEKLLTRRNAKTPDFRIRLEQAELVAEVKSPGLGSQIERQMGRSCRFFWSKPGKRVRDLIRDSEDQLAAWASEVPKIVVICDLRHLLPDYPLYALHDFSDADVAAGMFGDMVFRCWVQGDRVVHNGPELGGNRTLRQDRHTHVSAVALHLVGRDLQLGPFCVYHNPFAVHPLPHQWFRQPGDRHFEPAKEVGGLVIRWEERA